jgi:hypothetical protein
VFVLRLFIKPRKEYRDSNLGACYTTD